MKSVNGKSILVVDDDAAMLRAVSKLLSSEGATVTAAGRPEEALRHLAEKQVRFDLIIIDLRMPNISGQTVLAAAKVALPEVPAIVITAFGNPEVQAQCLRQGAAAFLEKPMDATTLLAWIARVLPSPPSQAFSDSARN
jgi:DNA-binding NtrC family response regulator